MNRNHPGSKSSPSGLPAVSARNLAVGYDGTPIVEGITFALSGGQALALVGMNGSGKSTLLKAIVDLLPALGGDVEIFGAAPGRAPAKTAYLSQFQSSDFLLPLRAIDIVQMGRFAVRGLLGRFTQGDHELVADSLRRMDIAHLAEEPVRSLSGGQRQRVYLAQVFARRADLLVLDEPTASLDAAGREVFARELKRELSRGAAAIMATHDIGEASKCDLVMLLARRVVALGTPAEVLGHETLLETFGITPSYHER